MTNKLTRGTALLLATIMLVGLAACGGGDASEDPRQTVIAMFGAMEKNDKGALLRLLDIPELMKSSGEDYSVQTDNPREWKNPEEILADLTGDGKTKEVWFKHQRIVNKAQVMGTSATVEVTFVNKEASKGYRTEFGLHRKHGKWMIYSFQTMREGS